jgi:hypothetical protein
MTRRRPAMTRRRPGRYRGNRRRLMSLGPVGLLGRIPPAPVAASTGGGRGVEGPRYRSSPRQAATRRGGIAVAVPLLLGFRGKRSLWWDPTKLKAPAPAMRPNTESGCPKEPQTHDQQGEAKAPHPGPVGRAELPSLDSVVRDEGTLSGASREDRRSPCKAGLLLLVQSGYVAGVAKCPTWQLLAANRLGLPDLRTRGSISWRTC